MAVDTRNRRRCSATRTRTPPACRTTNGHEKVEENTKAAELHVDGVAVDGQTTLADNVGRRLRPPTPTPTLTAPRWGDASNAARQDDTDHSGGTTGQIEVGAGTKLDYETKDTYMVTVTAETPLAQRHHHGDHHGHQRGRSAGGDRRRHSGVRREWRRAGGDVHGGGP